MQAIVSTNDGTYVSLGLDDLTDHVVFPSHR